MSGRAEDELRKAMRATLEKHSRTDSYYWADETAVALLPVVTAWAKQQARERAAAELESAAAVHWADKVRWAEVRLDLRARAAALAAGQEPR